MKKTMVIICIILFLFTAGCEEEPVEEIEMTGPEPVVEPPEPEPLPVQTEPSEPWDTASYCDRSDIDSVYVCDNKYLKVVSNVPGAGARYFKRPSTEFHCPVVAPDYMSEDCKDLMQAECEQIC